MASDSQAAIRRCLNLTTGVQEARSWIDERVLEAAKQGGRELAWVKGHSGVEGNERADRRAKGTVMRGQWNLEPSLVTPAGIRQAYPLFDRAPHLKWDRDALRGLSYLHTDRGPMRAWLHQIGRAEDQFCECGETQNAAHLLSSGCIEGEKRKGEEIWTDREFCGKVARFLRRADKGGRG